MVKLALYFWICITLLAGAPLRAAEAPHALIPEYCNVLITYACHAQTLWHEEPAGGYWGDGLDAKDQNGAVRGTCNTLLTYAMLIKAMDNDWIDKSDRQVLIKAGLNREKLLDYVRKNLAYLVAHHKSSGHEGSPTWGSHWQSSLWMQSMGMGALLCWKELGEDLKQGIARCAAAEADWVVSKPPKDALPGDTGAEENAWNTGALAVSLSLNPDSTSSPLWWQGLKSFSVNTYSHPSDKATTGAAPELVSTTNVNADWSLENHHFFHPDYVQVSGMHLGEAWLILKLGDELNGSSLAKDYEPFGTHNVLGIWQKVLKPLVLTTGEFAYPSGNDWTYHCTTNQGYFAYIATAFQDYDASEAEVRALDHVKNRRDVSPPGRLLGDSNLAWWWEPLVCKRICTAMLHHAMRPGVASVTARTKSIDQQTTTVHLRDVAVWAHRTPKYFFSVSYRKPLMGYYFPLEVGEQGVPYTTLPIKDSILPPGPWEFKASDAADNAGIAGGTFWREGKVIGAVLCMDNSIAVISRVGFTPIRIENDSLTEPGRIVHSEAGKREMATFAKGPAVAIPGNWLSVDDTLGLAGSGSFRWKAARGWEQKSVAYDSVSLTAEAGIMQLTTGDKQAAANMAKTLVVDVVTTGVAARLQDGGTGASYRVYLTDEEFRLEPAGANQ